MQRLDEGSQEWAEQIIDEAGPAQANGARVQWGMWMHGSGGGLTRAYTDALGATKQGRSYAHGHRTLARAVSTWLAQDLGLSPQATPEEFLHALIHADEQEMVRARVKALLAALHRLAGVVDGPRPTP